MNRTRRQKPVPRTRPREDQRPKKPTMPTVDLHIQVGLTDMLLRISEPDFQRFLSIWVLAEETVIFRGPYKGMETDIVMRGTESAMFSVRPTQEQNKVHKWKLISADEYRKEQLAKAGL